MSLIPCSSVFAARIEFVRAIGAAALLLSAVTAAHTSEKAVVLPPPTIDMAQQEGEQIAVIAGGCFWGIQGVYQHTEGVIQAMSGYSGGTKQTALYEVVKFWPDKVEGARQSKPTFRGSPALVPSSKLPAFQ
jgi:hypothetical protein